MTDIVTRTQWATETASIRYVTKAPGSTLDYGGVNLLDTSGGAASFTMPDPEVSPEGALSDSVLAKVSGPGAATVNAAGGNTIDGGASVELTETGDAREFLPNGTNWEQVSDFGISMGQTVVDVGAFVEPEFGSAAGSITKDTSDITANVLRGGCYKVYRRFTATKMVVKVYSGGLQTRFALYQAADGAGGPKDTVWNLLNETEHVSAGAGVQEVTLSGPVDVKAGYIYLLYGSNGSSGLIEVFDGPTIQSISADPIAGRRLYAGMTGLSSTVSAPAVFDPTTMTVQSDRLAVISFD